MDQVKIGNFIAECRKQKGFTQLQLAEKLNITDKAVSKWERGRAMPDSSIMLGLCDALGISVNELLSGEMDDLKDYNKELENRLLEMVKEKEQRDKQLLILEWVIVALSLIVLFIPTVIIELVQMEEWLETVIVFSGFIPALIGLCFALKIEQIVGYYECRKCGHKYVPTYKAVNLAPHVGRTRYMKCPECGRYSWQKKVLNK